MRLAAWHPTSLTDYPGKVAAVLFTAGCNFRCPFCHNPELVLPEFVERADLLDDDELFAELSERSSFLDGVVITGGEPTLQPELNRFIERVKAHGLMIKLDTNGARPDVVEKLLEQSALDYVAVDAKAPPERYEEVTGVADVSKAVSGTIGLLKRSRVDFEVRTTVAPGLSASDVEAIADWIGDVPRYVLQPFRVPVDQGKRLLDPTWADRDALGVAELRSVWKCLSNRFVDGGVRG